ncbi:hypothetical protein ACOMHN_040374 [Nucella lapillus]
MVLQPLHTGLLLIISVMAICARKEKEEHCTLGGQRYKLGQTWHPTLAPFDQKECINCTCYQGGEVNCVKIDCPRPDCEVPKILPGDCCPSCEDFDNLPPTVGKEGSREKEEERPGCEFDGKSFKDGGLFPSNTTGIRPTRSDQCVICHCSIGTVLCQLKTCLPTKCKKFKSVPDDCCPQCADKYDFSEDLFDYVLSDPKQENRTDADCVSPMGLHKNGSSWKPVIAEYGEMECIVCTCLNGNFTCKRLDCPPEEALPCKRPRQMPGSCCKVCPPPSKNRRRNKGGRRRGGKNRSPEQDSNSGSDRPQKAEEGGGRRREGEGGVGGKGGGGGGGGGGSKRGRGKKRKRNRKRKNKGHNHRKCKASDKEEVHPERKANVTSVAAIFPELCLPRRMDRIVYRVKGDDYDLLAFDSVLDPSVEVLRWNVEKGRSQAVNRTILQAREFRSTLFCHQIIGSTNKRGFKKMLKKVEAKTRRCTSKKRRCLSKALDKVIKRERRLKPLPTQRVCGE